MVSDSTIELALSPEIPSMAEGTIRQYASASETVVNCPPTVASANTGIEPPGLLHQVDQQSILPMEGLQLTPADVDVVVMEAVGEPEGESSPSLPDKSNAREVSMQEDHDEPGVSTDEDPQQKDNEVKGKVI